MSADHDRHFFDTFLIVLGALVAFTIAIYFLAGAIHARTQGRYIDENPLKAQMISERLAPVAQLAIDGQPGPKPPVSAPAVVTPAPVAKAEAVDGKSVYESACFACHMAGVAGAPKLGDSATWSQRTAKGTDTLYANAINGYQGQAGIMPAKGGRADLSDEQVRAAVDYMVQQSK